MIACLGSAAAGFGMATYVRAAANTPAGLAYAGLLKNGGAIEPGVKSHDVVFELFDGNAVLCTDTRSGLVVSDGRFDVPNLFASNGCLLDSNLASKPQLFVRLEVDGERLAPPQALGTVPYSARARVAETAEALVKPKFVNVTTHVGNTRTVLMAAPQLVLETFTVDKRSPTSILIVEGAISAFGSSASGMQQGWKYGGAPEILAQGLTYSTNDANLVIPTKAVIAGWTTTGPQPLTLRYFSSGAGSDGKPFLVYNPNNAEHPRLAQTQSVYVVTEIEP
jgi:hypothetical protein